jgi:hypothetical protein
MALHCNLILFDLNSEKLQIKFQVSIFKFIAQFYG